VAQSVRLWSPAGTPGCHRRFDAASHAPTRARAALHRRLGAVWFNVQTMTCPAGKAAGFPC